MRPEHTEPTAAHQRQRQVILEAAQLNELAATLHEETARHDDLAENRERARALRQLAQKERARAAEARERAERLRTLRRAPPPLAPVVDIAQARARPQAPTHRLAR